MLNLWNRGKDQSKPEPSTAIKLKPSLFKGISDREVASLYNLAQIRQVHKAAFLYREKDLANTLFVVVSGLIQSQQQINNLTLEGTTYGEGDWIVGADFDRPVYRLDSAVALETSTVLVLNKESFLKLDDSVQRFVYRSCLGASNQWMQEQDQGQRELHQDLARVQKELVRVRSQGKSDFVQSEVIQSVIKKIPRLPVATVGIVNKLLYEEVTTLEMVDLVRNDPALTSLLLKNINSSFYNFKQKIGDVNHAVGLFGFDAVYQIIMAESIRQSLPDTPLFQEVYQHSLQLSHIAFAVSMSSQQGRPSELATLGLVHSTGRIVIELLKKQNPKLAGLIDMIDSAEVGAKLLTTWNLPERICKSIRYQYHPEYNASVVIPKDVQSNAAILYVSQLCYQLLHKTPQQELPTLYLKDYLNTLGWEQLSLREIVQTKVVPVLSKRTELLPEELRQLL